MSAEKRPDRASLDLLYHISRELAAALDLPTVLERVLRLSIENVGASSGSLLVLDQRGDLLDGVIVVESRLHGATARQLKPTLERGLAGWTARTRQAALVNDTSRDERWLPRPGRGAAAGPRSAVSVPILVRDELVGVMTLSHPTPGFFIAEDLSLVQAIADQAGIAIVNARLYAESQQKARVMAALAESAASITSSLNLDDVLQHILEETSQALRVESVSLALLDPDDQELVFQACSGDECKKLRGMRLPLGQGVAGWVAKEGRGLVIPDVRKDERFSPLIDHQIGFKTRALACAPMQAEDQVIGVLEAINPLEGAFDADALKVLTGIGSLAGTAIRHAQLFERIQAVRQRYWELFEDSIDPILITDLEGNIQEANRQACRLTGFSGQDLQRLNVQELGIVQPEKVGEDFSQIPTGEPLSYEGCLSAPTNPSIPVQVYARRVSIDHTAQFQWILRDLSERKKLESWRDDLLAMVYHDLRSPLSNVVSALDLLEMLLPLEEYPSAAPVLQIATRSTQRIQRLTNSLLDIRRLEAGQPLGERRPASPRLLAEEAVGAVQPGKSQQICTTVPAELPDVLVDGEMVRRVLINLLENAVKYTPPSSTITLGAAGRPGEVEMWVRDDGPGIPLSERERIFEKYARIERDNKQKGLGLGLAFCRLAVESHGGRIWVESAPGEGACFHLTLPAILEL